MKKLVGYLTRELNLDKSQQEIIAYGLYSLIYTSLSIIVALAFALLFGILTETACILFVVMLYRKVSGGAHVCSPHGCLIIGTGAVLLLAHLAAKLAPQLDHFFTLQFLPPVIAAVIAYIRVPADVPQKPITSPQQIKMLRVLSFTFLICWSLFGFFAIQSVQLSYYFFTGNLGLLWQSFLLTPGGYRLIAVLDPLFRQNR